MGKESSWAIHFVLSYQGTIGIAETEDLTAWGSHATQHTKNLKTERVNELANFIMHI